MGEPSDEGRRTEKRAEAEARRARALRDNLRKRNQQRKARTAHPADAS